MLLGDFTTGVSLLCPALQVCGHPRLVQEPEEDLAGNTSQLLQASGKLQVLHELLQRLKAQGRRVLVLSAMQKVRVLAAHMYNPLERHAGADHAVEMQRPQSMIAVWVLLRACTSIRQLLHTGMRCISECFRPNMSLPAFLLQALDLLQGYCEAEHGCTERVDTTVPAAARHVAMQRFSERDRCAVSSHALHTHSALRSCTLKLLKHGNVDLCTVIDGIWGSVLLFDPCLWHAICTAAGNVWG